MKLRRFVQNRLGIHLAGLLLGLTATAATVHAASENEWLVPLAPPPKATPQRMSGGEAVPPLPLPATPLRRSEHKREPSPQKLMAKIMWGETADFKHEGGLSTQVSDWNQAPADVQQILGKVRGPLATPYTADAINLSAFNGDPTQIPLLFFSGSRTIKFDDKQIELLRNYVIRGGVIMGDAVIGSPHFYESFKLAMERAFPEQAWRVVPEDHPVYHMVTDVTTVKYPRNLKSDKPLLEAMYIHSRCGVIVSKYGLGCGWDNREPWLTDELKAKAIYYDPESASKIGMNLMAYVVGYGNVARESAKPELFGTVDEKRPTDEFVFAQIKHEGAWNAHSGGAAALLQRMRRDTSVKVSVKRVPVAPGKDDLANFTFLYLTGLDDFKFDGAAVASLRNFLNAGGTLLINNGLGMRTFDEAVRRELKAILPGSELKVVPGDHALFSAVHKIKEAQYTTAVQRLTPNRKLIDEKIPHVEGITLNGDLKVIYSPFDLEAGWQGMEHPLAKAYEPEGAMQLGMNIVMYSMTH